MNEQSKNTMGSVFLGVATALLVLTLLLLAYLVYNNSVNSADNYGTDFYHKINYCQSVKTSGKSYLNVKWPRITDPSWEFTSLDYYGEEYVVGTCKVTAEGNPEKIDVVCVFQERGRSVRTAFFMANNKVYYDGIDLTRQVINELLGQGTEGNWKVTSTTSSHQR